jgi:hypothetical protein
VDENKRRFVIMGLDIDAYRKIKRVASLDDRDVEDDEVFLFINPDFPRYTDNLVKGIYSYEGDYFTFRAGSYSGYNQWRSDLAKLVGKTDQEIWDNPVPGPFVELINNSDCDTVIGPVTSKKLYEDFKDHLQEAIDRHLVPDTPGCEDWFVHQYKLWLKAFEIASDGGCVVFA